MADFKEQLKSIYAVVNPDADLSDDRLNKISETYKGRESDYINAVYKKYETSEQEVKKKISQSNLGPITDTQGQSNNEPLNDNNPFNDPIKSNGVQPVEQPKKEESMLDKVTGWMFSDNKEENLATAEDKKRERDESILAGRETPTDKPNLMDVVSGRSYQAMIQHDMIAKGIRNPETNEINYDALLKNVEDKGKATLLTDDITKTGSVWTAFKTQEMQSAIEDGLRGLTSDEQAKFMDHLNDAGVMKKTTRVSIKDKDGNTLEESISLFEAEEKYKDQEVNVDVVDQSTVQWLGSLVGGQLKPMVTSMALATFTGGAGIIAAPISAGGMQASSAYGGTYQEKYNQAIKEGHTKEQAVAIAQDLASDAAISSGIEGAVGALNVGGKLGGAGMAGYLKGTLADAVIDAGVAGGLQYAQNKASQGLGLSGEDLDGVVENMAGEAVFSVGMGLIGIPGAIQSAKTAKSIKASIESSNLTADEKSEINAAVDVNYKLSKDKLADSQIDAETKVIKETSRSFSEAMESGLEVDAASKVAKTIKAETTKLGASDGTVKTVADQVYLSSKKAEQGVDSKASVINAVKGELSKVKISNSGAVAEAVSQDNFKKAHKIVNDNAFNTEADKQAAKQALADVKQGRKEGQRIVKIDKTLTDIKNTEEGSVTFNRDGSVYKAEEQGDSYITTLKSKNVDDATGADIAAFEAENATLLAASDDVVVGVYKMQDGGYSIDLNFKTQDGELATEFARRNNQEGIYSTKDARETGDGFIPTDGDGNTVITDDKETIVAIQSLLDGEMHRFGTKAEPQTTTETKGEASDNHGHELFNKTRKTDKAVSDLLSKSFPNIEVVSDSEAVKAMQNDISAKRMISKDDKVLGYVKDGKVFLNPDASTNTRIHEMGHVWINAMKSENTSVHQKGIDLVKDSPYYKIMENSEAYAKIAGSLDQEAKAAYIAEEALAMAIGDKGQLMVDAAQKKSFSDWLTELWKTVKEIVGIKHASAEQVQDMSLSQFVDGVVADLLSGEKISDVTSADLADAGTRLSIKKGDEKKSSKSDEMRRHSKKVKDQEVDQEYEVLKEDVLDNPTEHEYSPETISDSKTFLESMSDDDLNQLWADGQAQMSGLKALFAGQKEGNTPGLALVANEMMKRAALEGNKELLVELGRKTSELGTDFGQQLQAFTEIDHLTTGMVMAKVEADIKSAIEENLGKEFKLSDEQERILVTSVEAMVEAKNIRDASKEKVLNDPTPENMKQFAEDQAQFIQYNGEFIKTADALTPQSMSSLYGSLLKGSLLTAKSLAVNVVGNVVYAPYLGFLNGVSDIFNSLGGVPMPTMQVIKNAPKMYWRGSKQGAVEAWHNRTTDAYEKFDGYQRMQGIDNLSRAFGALFGKKPSKYSIQDGTSFSDALFMNVAVDKKTGKKSKKGKAEQIIQSTLGVIPDAMYRGLAFGDKGPRYLAEFAAINRIAAWRLDAKRKSLLVEADKAKLDGNEKAEAAIRKEIENIKLEQPTSDAEIALFKESLTKAEKEVLQKASDRSVYTHKSGLGKFMLDMFTNAEVLADRGGPVGKAGKVLMNIAMPFRTVPANVAMTALDSMIPVIPMARIASLSHSLKGMKPNTTEWYDAKSEIGREIGKMLTGLAVWAIVGAIAKRGGIIFSTKDDTKEGRALKREVAGGGNGVNISLVGRMLAGAEDPKIETNDTWVDFTQMGHYGVVLNTFASYHDAIAKGDIEESDLAILGLDSERLVHAMSSFSEQAYVQGLYNAMDQIERGRGAEYMVDLTETALSPTMPNTISSIFQKPYREYARNYRNLEGLDYAQGKIQDKYFDSGKSLPYMDIHGNFSKQNPDGAKAGRFFGIDPLKARESTASEIYVEIANLATKYGYDIMKSPKTDKVSLYVAEFPGREIVLLDDPDFDAKMDELEKKYGEDYREKSVEFTTDEQDNLAFQAIGSKYIDNELIYLMSDPEWEKMSNKEKYEEIKAMTAAVSKGVKAELTDHVLDRIENGDYEIDTIEEKLKYKPERGTFEIPDEYKEEFDEEVEMGNEEFRYQTEDEFRK